MYFCLICMRVPAGMRPVAQTPDIRSRSDSGHARGADVRRTTPPPRVIIVLQWRPTDAESTRQDASRDARTMIFDPTGSTL